jgi:hypothetical protein
MTEKSSSNKIGISIAEILGMFLIGFTFFIACFDEKLAGAYILFIILSSFLILFLKHIKGLK